MASSIRPGADLTKVKIVFALESLLEGSRYEDITVSQICAKAGISRQTFYRHFGSKYDIAAWNLVALGESTLFQTGRTLNWFDANYEMNYLIAQNKPFYHGVLKYDYGYESLTEQAFRRRKETLVETLVHWQGKELTDLLEFQIDVLARTEVSVITGWCQRGMDVSPLRLAELQQTVIPRELFRALNTPVNPRPASMGSAPPIPGGCPPELALR